MRAAINCPVARSVVYYEYLHVARARRETVCASMVYQHLFGRLEIIPTLLSGRLPYRYAVGHSIAATFTVHSAVHEIWSVDVRKIIKIVASRCVSGMAQYAKNVFAARTPSRTLLGELTVLPRPHPSWI